MAGMCNASIAQLVEHSLCKRKVQSSILCVCMGPDQFQLFVCGAKADTRVLSTCGKIQVVSDLIS